MKKAEWKKIKNTRKLRDRENRTRGTASIRLKNRHPETMGGEDGA